MNAFTPTPRARLSPKDRARLFSAAGGRCASCTRTIRAGERWDADHVLPLAAGGTNDDGNWQVLCEFCHSAKTKGDVSDAAKIKRVATKHVIPGRLSRRPMAGSKASGWKKKMDGTVERRS